MAIYTILRFGEMFYWFFKTQSFAGEKRTLEKKFLKPLTKGNDCDIIHGNKGVVGAMRGSVNIMRNILWLYL